MADQEAHASIQIQFSPALGDLRLELEEDANATTSSPLVSAMTVGSSYLLSPKGGSPRVAQTFAFGSAGMPVQVQALRPPSYLNFRGAGSGNGRMVRMTPAGSGATLYTNFGDAQVIATQVSRYVLNEEVTFIDSDESQLQYIPEGAVSWGWAGRHYGGQDPIFDQGSVKLSEKCICGVLQCSYSTLFDRVEVIFNDVGAVLLVARAEDSVASLEINFATSQTASTTQPGTTTVCSTSSTQPSASNYKNVMVTVRDYCSDALLAGVLVHLGGPTGNHDGVTNANGQVIFPNLQVGGTYVVQMSKDGYMVSTNDSLNNDSVVIA